MSMTAIRYVNWFNSLFENIP